MTSCLLSDQGVGNARNVDRRCAADMRFILKPLVAWTLMSAALAGIAEAQPAPPILVSLNQPQATLDLDADGRFDFHFRAELVEGSPAFFLEAGEVIVTAGEFESAYRNSVLANEGEPATALLLPAGQIVQAFVRAVPQEVGDPPRTRVLFSAGFLVGPPTAEEPPPFFSGAASAQISVAGLSSRGYFVAHYFTPADGLPDGDEAPSELLGWFEVTVSPQQDELLVHRWHFALAMETTTGRIPEPAAAAMAIALALMTPRYMRRRQKPRRNA